LQNDREELYQKLINGAITRQQFDQTRTEYNTKEKEILSSLSQKSESVKTWDDVMKIRDKVYEVEKTVTEKFDPELVDIRERQKQRGLAL
jgi:paraquat-inducible protein B